MKKDRVVLLIAGLLGIVAFFLPYFTFEKSFLGVQVVNKSMSGYTYVRTVLDMLEIYSYDGGKVVVQLIEDLWNSAAGAKDYLLASGAAFVLTGPLIFLIFSISYVIKALKGKTYSRGIFFTLIYAGIAWLVFFFISRDNTTEVLGQQIGIKLEFFKMASAGFWLAFSGMVLAALSLFFAKMKS